MLNKHFFLELFLIPFNILLRVKSNSGKISDNVSNILIIWSDCKFGFFLSGKVLFRALKQKYPHSRIIIFTNDPIIKQFYNGGYSKLLGFDDSDKIISFRDFKYLLSINFDVTILPSIEKFSFVNHFLMRISKSKRRIGIFSLHNIINPYSFLFDRKIESDWTSLRDTHISEYFMELLKPFDIYQSSDIFGFTNYELSESEKSEILLKAGIKENQKIIVLNNEPEEIHNKWGIENLVGLITLFVQSGDFFFYYIEHNMDPVFKKMLESDVKILHYINKNNLIELMKIFSICDLVITCDSNIMHLAGLNNVPQVSIFGLNNPFNWAPLGPKKRFIKKTDLINEITAQDVFDLAQPLLGSGIKNE